MKRIDWEKNTTSDAAQQKKKKEFFPTYFDDAKKQETTRYYYRKDELKTKERDIMYGQKLICPVDSRPVIVNGQKGTVSNLPFS